MLDRIISFSLSHRWLVAIAALALAIAGCWVSTRSEVDVFPDLNAPVVAVMAEAPGMASEEVERQVTLPVENALNGVAGMRRVRSTSSAGFSVVRVEFDWDTDPWRARQNVAERLSGLSLPGDAVPVMGPPTSVLGEVVFVAVTGKDMTPMNLRTLADSRVAPRLASLPGVAQVSVLGGDVKQFQILLDPARMGAYGVTLAEVTEALRDFNANVSGGTLTDFGNEYLVRGVLSTDDAERLGVSVVRAGENGSPAVLLENIADIEASPMAPRTGAASVSGSEAVLMTVTKQPGADTAEVTEAVEKAVASLAPALPKGVKLRTDLYRQQDFIDASIGNIKQSLIEGGIFVCIVLFIFLMNPRTTLISIVTIPLALVMTVLALHLLGLSINTMSIGGIAIAIGSLVDDAVVDVENVFKRLRADALRPPEERKGRLRTVFEASREVRMPILNSTLIIIVSFVPLFFLSGIEGRMLVPLGTAFIIALLASTLVALTLTPVLCSWLLPEKSVSKAEPKFITWLRGKYMVSLDWTLRHAKGVLGGAAALFCAAIGLFFTFGSSFLPPFNEGSFTVNITAFPGISLEESDSIGKQAERILLGIPEITRTARKTGRAELDEHSLGTNVSEIEVPFKLGHRPKAELMEDMRHRLSVIRGANVEIGQPISHRIDAMLSGTEANVAVKVYGDDPFRLQAICQAVGAACREVEGVAEVSVPQTILRPQLRIEPKREVLAHYGMSLPEFSQTVSSLAEGIEVAKVYEGNLSRQIVVKSSPSYASSLEEIGDYPVTLSGGRRVPLSVLADISVADGPDQLSRENLERMAVVGVNISGADLGSTVEAIRKSVEEDVRLPEGYRIEYGGQFEAQREASRTLALTSLFSLLAIFLLLYNQFRNTRQSLTVMINLPLALIGGVVALALSSRVVSIPAVIGFISLFGIATRNGMLLVDRYNELVRRGVPIRRAVEEGSADRLNPILMTALTSALALIPLAAGGATPGNEIQSPMAKVILGGLISSTLLNCYVIPAVYILGKWKNTSGKVLAKQGPEVNFATGN